MVNDANCIYIYYIVHTVEIGTRRSTFKMIEQCTGKAGGVQTESGPGFDRGQHDCVDNKVFFWWILTLDSSDVTEI